MGSMTEAETVLRWVEMQDAMDPRQLDTWGGPVQGYVNRIGVNWAPADFEMHETAGYMRTSVRREAFWAQICREIDVETGAALPMDVPSFILYREHLGHSDGGVYVNQSNWPVVRDHLEAAGIGPARVRVRVAMPDGDPGLVPLLGGGYVVWAKQFAWLGNYDRNAVYGETDFSHG